MNPILEHLIAPSERPKPKERPILFSGPMVKAILEGRKTQTRRVVKHIPMLGGPLGWCAAAKAQEPGWVSIVGDFRRFCPYGQTGNRLWVRETWSPDATTMYPYPKVWFRAERDIEETNGVHTCPTANRNNWGDCLACWEHNNGKFRWRPSIHMPRAVSRINLEITGVRVERLQDISEADAQAEGVRAWMASLQQDGFHNPDANLGSYPVTAFGRLWESINGKRGFGWDTNPWVWVVEFKQSPGGNNS